MGEMADMVLEETEEAEELRSRWRKGEMTDVEAYEESIIDEQGFEPNATANKPQEVK